MKKTSSYIILFLFLIGLYGCQQNGETLKKITINSMKINSETLVIEDTNTIEKIKAAVKKAEKQPGIVNMADPEYKIVIGEETYFLWIDVKSGTIINAEDTHTIYSLSNSSINLLNELLE